MNGHTTHSIATTQSRSGWAMLFIVLTRLGLAQNWRNCSTLRSWNVVFVSLTTAFHILPGSLDRSTGKGHNRIVGKTPARWPIIAPSLAFVDPKWPRYVSRSNFHDRKVYDGDFNLRDKPLLTQVSVRASPDRIELGCYILPNGQLA